jgi:hypothetical protein
MRLRHAPVLALLLTAACARTYITSDEAGRQVTGVPYYTARPYFVVSKTDERGRPTEGAITFIPDRSTPQYVVQQPGLGNGGFTLSMMDGTSYKGYLTSFDKSSTEIKVGEFVQGVANTAVTVLTGMIVADEIKKLR